MKSPEPALSCLCLRNPSFFETLSQASKKPRGAEGDAEMLKTHHTAHVAITSDNFQGYLVEYHNHMGGFESSIESHYAVALDLPVGLTRTLCDDSGMCFKPASFSLRPKQSKQGALAFTGAGVAQTSMPAGWHTAVSLRIT